VVLALLLRTFDMVTWSMQINIKLLRTHSIIPRISWFTWRYIGIISGNKEEYMCSRWDVQAWRNISNWIGLHPLCRSPTVSRSFFHKHPHDHCKPIMDINISNFSKISAHASLPIIHMWEGYTLDPIVTNTSDVVPGLDSVWCSHFWVRVRVDALLIQEDVAVDRSRNRG
jgi:hypothetical protein